MSTYPNIDPSDLVLVAAGSTTIQQCFAGEILKSFTDTISEKRKHFSESGTLTCVDVLRKAMKCSRSCRLESIFILKVCSSSNTFVALSVSSVALSDGDAVLVLFSCSVRALKGLSWLLVPLGGWELVLLVSLGGSAYLFWSRICLRISASWFTI